MGEGRPICWVGVCFLKDFGGIGFAIVELNGCINVYVFGVLYV